MKPTLDPLTNLNRDPDLTRAWGGHENPAAGEAEEKHGCRCDRWGHPCPGCGKLAPPLIPPPTAFIEPPTRN